MVTGYERYVCSARRLMSGRATLPWQDLVVLCAADAFDGIQGADQHMAENLSVSVPVLYVDPPISRLTPLRDLEAASRLKAPRLRIIRPGLARLTPVVLPFPGRRGMVSLTSLLLRRIL